MTLDDLTPEQIEAEWRELRQVISIIAASYPSRYILGKTADRVSVVCKLVADGKPLLP